MDICFKIPFFGISRRSGGGGLRAFQIDAVQYSAQPALRVDACGLPAAQLSITVTAYDTEVEWASRQ